MDLQAGQGTSTGFSARALAAMSANLDATQALRRPQGDARWGPSRAPWPSVRRLCAERSSHQNSSRRTCRPRAWGHDDLGAVGVMQEDNELPVLFHIVLEERVHVGTVGEVGASLGSSSMCSRSAFKNSAGSPIQEIPGQGTPGSVARNGDAQGMKGHKTGAAAALFIERSATEAAAALLNNWEPRRWALGTRPGFPCAR